MLLALLLLAAQDTTNLVRGIVHDTAGRPVMGADVFLVATLEGSATDSAGRFSFKTAARGTQELMARKIGFSPTRITVTLPAPEPIQIAIGKEPTALQPITVAAGAYIAGEERGAQLTPL